MQMKSKLRVCATYVRLRTDMCVCVHVLVCLFLRVHVATVFFSVYFALLPISNLYFPILSLFLCPFELLACVGFLNSPNPFVALLVCRVFIYLLLSISCICWLAARYAFLPLVQGSPFAAATTTKPASKQSNDGYYRYVYKIYACVLSASGFSTLPFPFDFRLHAYIHIQR